MQKTIYIIRETYEQAEQLIDLEKSSGRAKIKRFKNWSELIRYLIDKEYKEVDKKIDKK